MAALPVDAVYGTCPIRARRTKVDIAAVPLQTTPPAAPEGISETVSDIPQPKRGRGRPRYFGQKARDLADDLYPHVTTERGRNNRFYMMIALQMIVDATGPDAADRRRYDWLAPDGSIVALMPGLSTLNRFATKTITGGAMKTTLLSELGRVAIAYGEDAMKRVALQLCEMEPKPTTKEAVALVRRWRVQPSRAPAQDENPAAIGWKLLEALAKFVDEYARTHTGVTPVVIDDALQTLCGLVLDSGDDAPQEAV